MGARLFRAVKIGRTSFLKVGGGSIEYELSTLTLIASCYLQGQMARPYPVLNDELVGYLNIRVYISRSIGAYTLTDLIEPWRISESTIHRYKSPAYRESSRRYARQAAMSYKNKRSPTDCYCGALLIGHPRCADCTVLMHDKRKLCGGVPGEYGCVDMRDYRTLLHYGPLISLSEQE